MISSASGRIALPFIGPYAASKMALEGLSDALRLELKPHGVSVSIIQPGPIETAMMERSIRAAEERFERMAPEANDLYHPALEAARASAIGTEQAVLPPEAVVRAVLHALEDRRARAPTWCSGAAGCSGWRPACCPTASSTRSSSSS